MSWSTDTELPQYLQGTGWWNTVPDPVAHTGWWVPPSIEAWAEIEMTGPGDVMVKSVATAVDSLTGPGDVLLYQDVEAELLGESPEFWAAPRSLADAELAFTGDPDISYSEQVSLPYMLPFLLAGEPLVPFAYSLAIAQISMTGPTDILLFGYAEGAVTLDFNTTTGMPLCNADAEITMGGTASGSPTTMLPFPLPAILASWPEASSTALPFLLPATLGGT